MTTTIMETLQIVHPTIHKNNSNSIRNDDNNKPPSDKSVETTSSSTIPSIKMQQCCMHIHDVEKEQEQRHHHHESLDGGEGDVVPSAYEIRIVDASSSSSLGDGHDNSNHRRPNKEEVTEVMQEKRPDFSLHVLTEHDDDEEVVSAQDVVYDDGVTAAAAAIIIVQDGNQVVPSSLLVDDAAAITTTLSSSFSAILSTTADTEQEKEETTAKLQQQQQQPEEEEVEVVISSPPSRHIYALRKIIVEYDNKEEKDGKEERWCADGNDALRLSMPPQSVVRSILDSQSSPPPCTNTTTGDWAEDNKKKRTVVEQMTNHHQVEGEENNVMVVVGTNALYDAEEDQLFYDAQEDIMVVVADTTTTDDPTTFLQAITPPPPDTKPPSPPPTSPNNTAIQTTPPPRSESPPDNAQLLTTTNNVTTTNKTKRTTRIIASQMINISEEENIELEEMSRGTVLCCSKWISDEDEKWRSKEEEEGEEEEEWNGSANASDSVPITTLSSPQGLSFCTTTNNNNNNDNTEEQITLVPYSMAKRRMGCNCTKKAEFNDVATTTNNGETKKKKRPFKAAYKLCQSIQRTLQLKIRKQHSSNNNNNNAGNSDDDQVGNDHCQECNFFGPNPTILKNKKGKRKKKGRRQNHHSPTSFRNVGARMYGEEAVLGNTAEPIHDILSIDSSLGIYVCESGLTALKCQEIIDAAERLAQSKGAWSAYTYAKQTLGCKEYDDLAEASEDPVMTACATVRDQLEEVWAEQQQLLGNNNNNIDSSNSSSSSSNEKKNVVTPPPPPPAAAEDKSDEEENVEEMPTTKPKLVLDAREPHVVKYDLSRMERQKLDMHTDRSVWTFIIALTEGRGQDYAGGGTFFEKLNATVHLQRGQMLIFRGKLRHRGVKITDGKRYLLVGFLVEQKLKKE